MIILFTVQEWACKQQRVLLSNGLSKSVAKSNTAKSGGGLLSSGSRKRTVTGSQLTICTLK
jgi:hypothetical protein